MANHLFHFILSKFVLILLENKVLLLYAQHFQLEDLLPIFLNDNKILQLQLIPHSYLIAQSLVVGFQFWKQEGLTLNPSTTMYLLRGLSKEEHLAQVGVGMRVIKGSCPEEVASKLSPEG